MGLYFEDFTVGQKLDTQKRTISEDDIMTFARLTGDDNRIHTDPSSARRPCSAGRSPMGCWDCPSLRVLPGRRASSTEP
jgi:acyl dehydratase